MHDPRRREYGHYLLRETIRVLLSESGEWEKHAWGEDREKGEPDVPSEADAYWQLLNWVDGNKGWSTKTIRQIKRLASEYPDVLRPPASVTHAYRVIMVTSEKTLQRLNLSEGTQSYHYAGGGGDMSQPGVSSWTTTRSKLRDLAYMQDDIHGEDRSWEWPAWMIVFTAPIKGNSFYLNWQEIPLLQGYSQHEVVLFGGANCIADVTRIEDRGYMFEYLDNVGN